MFEGVDLHITSYKVMMNISPCAHSVREPTLSVFDAEQCKDLMRGKITHGKKQSQRSLRLGGSW